MKTSYRKQLFLQFFILFSAFSIAIFIFQFKREHKFKREALETTLDTYSRQIHKFLVKNSTDSSNFNVLDQYLEFVPHSEMRITIIDQHGIVLFDTSIDDFSTMDNHGARPEITEASSKESGSSIRYSSSVEKDYFYYARKFGDYYIRTSLPYDSDTIEILRADNFFVYFLAFVFFIVLLFLVYISGQMGSTISKLRDFAQSAARNEKISNKLTFGSGELGEISNQIVHLYDSVRDSNEKLAYEKEKLFKHLQVSQSGLAVFSKDRIQLLSNSHFLNILQLFKDDPVKSGETFFEIEEFHPIIEFIEDNLAGDTIQQDYSQERLVVNVNNKYISVQSVVFPDSSFEIVLHDITKVEKSRIMKREITGNIAHELRTPVAAVKGYLETIIGNIETIQEKHLVSFMGKALKQTLRLEELINDLSLVSKMEEAAVVYDKTTFNISNTIFRVIQDLELKIRTNGGAIQVEVPDNLQYSGNEGLIYSVFRNFIDNSLKYGGNDVQMEVKLYNQIDNMLYFSMSNNGPSITEHHLSRLFERFYRIDEGRSRKVGGTGLGLSIVKNAITLHGGEIIAKNRQEGGIEFMFTLRV